MKTLKRILLLLLAVLAVALGAGWLLLRHAATRALPDYNESLVLEGLRGEVRVFRDEQAIPHVYAHCERDLYLAVGYVMAQDRLWQMDLLRRVTAGRLSEILGERMVETDLLMRALRIPEKARRVLEDSGPELREALEAFAEGVNLHIARSGGRLPPEFAVLRYRPEPWEPVHSASLIGYMAWDLSGSWNSELILHKLRQRLDPEKYAQLLPDMARHPTPVYAALPGAEDPGLFGLLEHAEALRELGLEVFSASNNWAVAPHRSATGRALLANDMHLGFSAPGIWYPMHQVVEGRLEVAGVVLPGQPLVVAGHNARIAWGMTNTYVDDADFFLETLDPEQQDRYRFEGEWRDLEVRVERIGVRGGGTVERELHFTHRGPVISYFKQLRDQAVSMSWTGNWPSNELRAIHRLNRAANWDHFRDALRDMTSLSQNVVYADVDGNIGMQTAGGVPLRAAGDGLHLQPGDTGRFDWTGLLPFEELPFTFNPPGGHVSSANNRTTGPEYPHHIGHQFDLPFRIDRIRALLDARERHGVADFQYMLADFRSALVARYLPGLLEILEGEPSLTPAGRQARDLLAQWDGSLDAGSGAAALFETFYIRFLEHLLRDEMGGRPYREFLRYGSGVRAIFDHVWSNPDSSWVDNVRTAEREAFADLVLTAFRESVESLQGELGADPARWRWGDLHRLTIRHPLGTVRILDRLFGLNRGPYPVGGSHHTVAPYGYSYRNPFGVTYGASQRHILQPGDWGANLVILPTGVSGIPASPYYLNQTEAFIEDAYHNPPWHRADVESRARYRAVLRPR